MRAFGPGYEGTDLSVPAPVGRDCAHCNEAIFAGDSGLIAGCAPFHRECLARILVGSVGHQQKKCSCYGGIEEDPPGMDKREAAQAAYAHAHPGRST